MDKRKIIYRVENEEGKGPYASLVLVSCKHPAPAVDGYNMLKYTQYFCGFISQNKIYEWFTEFELGVLKDKGFHISKYRVNEKFIKYPEDELQIIFLKDKAKKIGRIEITDVSKTCESDRVNLFWQSYLQRFLLS